MPIRFRCPVCQQLLGISRRKAGSNVQCPNCHNAVLVPAQDQEDELPAVPVPAPGLFDRDDFEQLLQGTEAAGTSRPRASLPPAPTPPRPAPIPPPVPVREAGGWSVEPVTVQPMPVGGIVLSPARATMLTVVVIVLIATSFAGGLVIGRFVL